MPHTETFDVLLRVASLLMLIVVLVQLLSLDILPFEQNSAIQVVGFIAVVLGVAVCISARITLGANWVHGAEYQIKKHQQLITSGAYKYIRHPIYADLVLSLVGAEVVAGSYVSIIFLVTLSVAVFMQAKQEEALLVKRFGKDYQEYMDRTKRFIPYVW